MNTSTVDRAPSRVRTLVASLLALFLVVAGVITAPPARAAQPGAVTGGSLSWGMDAAWVSMFAGFASATAPASWNGAQAVYPAAADGSSFDRASGTGTIVFSGAATSGYFAGPPMPGRASGNYFHVAGPRIVLDGTTGSLVAATVAGSSHNLNPALPTKAGTEVTIATLDLSAAPASSPTEVRWSNVPVAITAAGAEYFASYGSAGDAAATVRAAGSPLAPLSFSITTEAAPTATTTALAASPESSTAEGTDVTFRATVTPAAAGTVEFLAGEASLGSAPVAGATATITTAALAVGAHSVTARFTPASGSFAASTSSALTYTIESARVGQ